MEAKYEAEAEVKEGVEREEAAFFSILYDPVGYMDMVREKLPIAYPMAAIAIVCFVQILSHLVMRGPSPQFSIFAVTAGFFIHLAGKVTLLLVGSIMIHFFATSLSGTGKGWKLFSLFLVSQLPFIFILPLSLIARAFPTAGWFVYTFFLGLLTLWSFFLMILSIRENYRISPFWAAVIFILPGVIVVAGSAIFFSYATFKILLLIGP